MAKMDDENDQEVLGQMLDNLEQRLGYIERGENDKLHLDQTQAKALLDCIQLAQLVRSLTVTRR